MSALDELAGAVLAMLSIGDTTSAQPAPPAIDTGDLAASPGGCLQDLVDLHAWRPRGMHDRLT